MCASPKRTVWSLAEARAALERMVGASTDWSRLDEFLLAYLVEPVASRDGIRLELRSDARAGPRRRIEVHQHAAFAPIYLRKRMVAWRRRADSRPAPPVKCSVTKGTAIMASLAEMRVTSATQRDRIAETRRRAPEELRLLEALLFAAAEPLDEKTLAARLPDGHRCARALWRAAGRIRAARRQPRPRRRQLDVPHGERSRLAADPRSRSSRASCRAPRIETLAIIAYHQPVTRAEIEEIRGVSMSKGTLDVLLETGWIRPRGRRKAPGRPITYGTTEAFLSHFGLETLDDLPGLDELKGAGLFDGRLPAGFSCRRRPTIRRCATTKTRWSRAISISAWRRRPSARRE